MGLVYLAGCLMKSLWSIAKLRYLNEPIEWLNLWTTPVCAEVTWPLAEGEEAGVIIDSMHMELAYYIDLRWRSRRKPRRPSTRPPSGLPRRSGRRFGAGAIGTRRAGE